MRTTLNIDESALALIRRYAEERGLSLGQATSDLVHRAVECPPRFEMKNGWVQFEVKEGGGPLNESAVARLIETDAEEEFNRAISPRR